MITKAKKMQEKMKEVQESLKNIEVEGLSGGNSVRVILTGNHEMKSIKISEELKKENQDILNDLIIADTNDATLIVKQGQSEIVKELVEQLKDKCFADFNRSLENELSKDPNNFRFKQDSYKENIQELAEKLRLRPKVAIVTSDGNEFLKEIMEGLQKIMDI